MEKLNLRLFVSLAVLTIAIGWILISKNYLTCQVIYKADKTVEVAGKIIQAEVADDAGERARGLGGRQCIGKDQGMLFIFDREAEYGFWMKDMKFPIDIIWIDTNHHVVKIHPNVSPDTYPQVFKNDDPAQYVLELSAGKAAKLGIDENAIVQF